MSVWFNVQLRVLNIKPFLLYNPYLSSNISGSYEIHP
jgi:hypothetical protein